MKKGGSSRFSTPMRRTGGDSDVFFDKSSKKEKLRRLSCLGLLGEMDQLSHTISTNSTSKRFKLPKKLSDHCGMINHASAPRKLRSALKKRQHESQRSKDCTKKHKSAEDNPRESILTKDEEEVAEALFALAQTFQSNLNGTSEAEPSPVLQENIHIETPNEAEETKIVADVKKSRKRCSGHIYICHFINASDKRSDHKGLVTDYRPETTKEDASSSTRLQDLMGLHLTNPQNHHSTEKGGLYFVGSGPTLELTL